MSYVNTVDSKGDAAICKSILHKTLDAITDTYCEMVGGYAFYKFLALHTAIFANAKSIEQYAFAYCSALKTIEFPLSKSVGYFSFYECTNLEEADFPCVTSVGRYAFNGCTALKTLILRSGTLATLSDVNALEDTPIESGNGYIYVPSALYDSYRADSKWSTYANQFRKLEDYTVDGTVTGEVDTNRHMVRFFNDDGTFLCYVMVPNGGNAVYPGDEPVKEGEYAFNGWNPAPTNVTADMDVYAQFKSTITVSKQIVSRTISGDYVNDRVGRIGDYAFYKCTELASVDFSKVTTIGQYAFHSCTALTAVNFPKATTIGYVAFNSCSALEAAYFPEATTADNAAFQKCTNLKTANLPKVTDATTSLFWGCSELTSADFSALKTISSQAFVNCTKLESVILRGTQQVNMTSSNSFVNSGIAAGTGYIYVPASLVDKYKSATNWSAHANQFRAIEDYPEICGGDE
jgi:hypothetical protein